MSNDISVVTSKVPAHVKKGSKLGNENVSSEHISVPRVKLLQKMNHEVDPNHSEYLEGAKEGDFINTVTGENYGSSMYVVNVHFKEEYVVWRKRTEGGGLVGNFTTRKEAEDHLEDNGLKVEEHDITQTQIHTLLRLDEETAEISDIPFLFDCASSKLKVSREWNTKIMKQGGDRFSYLWKMSSVPQSNAKGSWVNIDIQGVDWLKDEIYEGVKSFYQASFGNS
tara:strand:+ start:193 stop:864 length:672 start_codon:yes stop_codon:yes gene_type:complete